MRILALDDEVTYRSMYEDFFGMQDGVEIVTVSTVAAAVSELEKGEFDFVISDFYLNRAEGDGDGRDLVDVIVNGSRKERVIVVSGSTTKRVEEELLQKGVLKVFSKPFSFLAIWNFLQEQSS